MKTHRTIWSKALLSHRTAHLGVRELAGKNTRMMSYLCNAGMSLMAGEYVSSTYRTLTSFSPTGMGTRTHT